VGWMMGAMGAVGFWVFLVALNVALAAYAVWRMMRRPGTPGVDETYTYAPVSLVSSPVALEAAAGVYADAQEEACAEDTKSQIERTV